MHKFRDLLEKYTRFQGGYIWDWQDKCLVAKTEDGKEFFAYGGDFNESVVEWQNPPYMTNNGIVLPDLTPKPVALEAKQVYCPIIFEKIKVGPWQQLDPFGHFIIKNRSLVWDSTHYKVSYAIRENGYIIQTGNYELPYLKAGEEIPASFETNIEKKPNAEYHVEFSVQYAQDTPYAPAGYELGCYQFRLESGNSAWDSGDFAKPAEKSMHAPLNIEDTEHILRISGSIAEFTVEFDKDTGLIRTYMKKGKEYLAQGPVECLTRPRTGIDAQEGWGRYVVWKIFNTENTSASLRHFSAQAIGCEKALVETIREVGVTQTPYSILINSRYIIEQNGDIQVHHLFRMDPSLKDLPRVGMEIVIPEGFENLEYFGYGPTENYRDRKEAARLGVFESRVEAEHFPFIPPSENGGHEETRWLKLTCEDGRQIQVASPIPFHFDVHHNTIEDYNKAKHEHELIRRKESYLHVDTAHSGIGSDMGWSTMISEENRVKAQNYVLEYTISFR